MRNDKLVKVNITSELLKKATIEFNKDKIYRMEFDLLTDCLNLHKKNDSIEAIALKCGIIDITNSTHLSQYKSYISIYDLAKHIKNIKNIDNRLKAGDETLVDEIAVTGHKNLLSFASKYCCYHNICIYGRDDYSIYDGVLSENLPVIFANPKYNDCYIEYKNKKVKLTNRRLFGISNYLKKYDYTVYNDAIGYILKDLKIENKRRQFDHLIWHYNKNSNK